MALWNDVRFGARTLGKSAGFTALALATLAVGIGMTTAIFSVVYGVLLRPLDFAHPEQLVDLHEADANGRTHRFGDPNFEDLRAQAHSLQGAAEYNAFSVVVSGGAEPTRTTLSQVSQDFFPMLGARPLYGRGFLPEDQRFGAAPVALVSYGYWKQILGGTPDFGSRKLRIEDREASVVGVMPPEFSFPPAAEIWLPREIFERYGRTAHNWSVLARLHDGATVDESRAELNTVARRLKQQFGQDTTMSAVTIVPLRDAMTNKVRPALWVLLGAVGLLLLIACANVANLLLVQTAARQKEIAIRLALGATRWRVVQQLSAETLLLTVTGGALGVLTAWWGLRTLLGVAPGVLPRMENVSLSLPVLLFSVGLGVVVALALGVFGGLRSSAGLQPALAAGGRSQSGAYISQRASRLIVGGQLAVTLALVAGAALLGRSLLHVLDVNGGFRTERVLTMDLPLTAAVERPANDPSDTKNNVNRVRLMDELFARLRAIPGVEDVGGSTNLPLTGSHPDGTYIVMNPGEQPPSDISAYERLIHDKSRTGDADYDAATAGYFRVMGIPLKRGRMFQESDTLQSLPVALISESVARQKWPGKDALGQMIEFGNMDGDMRPLTVVGVVGDVVDETLERPAFPTIYTDAEQRPQGTGSFTVIMRASGNMAAVISAARQIARDLEPTVPAKFETLEHVVSGSVQGRRFNVFLVGVFAGTALLLAIAGMYGVMAYSVARRTNELGVRMALGATRTSILRLVLGQGLMTAVAGVAIGLGAALGLTRSMSSMMFGLSASDPLTLGAAGVLLILVALGACYIPARRATKVDPMVALRYD